MQPIDIENVFTYHPPSGPEQVEQYQRVRNGGKTLAELLDAEMPDGPEKTLAIRKIQEAVMWANAGIACAKPLVEQPDPRWIETPGGTIMPC